MKEEWLFRGALVPIDAATTAALVAEIKRLIDVVGGMALAQPEKGLFIDLIAPHEGLAEELAQPEQEPVGFVDSKLNPIKRPWVGLTDEFCITNMFDMGHHSLQIVFKSRKNADEFKAALKEKNT